MKISVGLLSIFIFVSIVSSCFSLLGDGSNRLIKESANNKHTKKVILFLRRAGATIADSYQVSVTSYKTEFNTVATGNVFTVDADHGKATLNPSAINFDWISDDTVEIRYDKNLRTFIQKKAVDGVAVIYQTK